MSGYGKSLSYDVLCEIYSKLKKLPIEVQKSLQEKGYHWGSKKSNNGYNWDTDGSVRSCYLSWLVGSEININEGKKFFSDFINHMKSKGYSLKYYGDDVSAESVLQMISDGTIDVGDNSNVDDCYLEYQKGRKALYTPNVIPLCDLRVLVVFGKPESVSYEDNRGSETVLYDINLNTKDMVRKVLDSYALDSSYYVGIELNKIVAYDPQIAHKYMVNDNSQDTKYNDAYLYIDLDRDSLYCYDDEYVYSVLDEFCPSLNSKYNWSSPKTLPVSSVKSLEKFFKEVLGEDYTYAAHLHMRDNVPVVDFLFKYEDTSNTNTEVGNTSNSLSTPSIETVRLTEWVIRKFGNNVKEVFIVFDSWTNSLMSCEVIARKNPDGELTLVIY